MTREDAYTGNPYEELDSSNEDNMGDESWPYWLAEPESWEEDNENN